MFLLLILGLCAPAAATNLTGTFKNPDGTPVNGKIIFLLSQPTRLNDQSAQIVPMVKIFSVANGVLEAGAFVYGNDVLVPGGTYYLVRLVDSNNNLLFEQKWSITGISLNLGTLTPTTTGVVFPDPLIKNLATTQAVQGPVSFSAPVTAFSLTLNGNLNPGAADSHDLGSSSAPWQELHALRWNSLFSVGNSSGTSAPPAAAPVATVFNSSGSIGVGTYYFKVTYFNRNGETTASPTRTLTVSSGATNRIHIGPGDNLWNSGCYGFITYASNDNVNFYAQTPSGVVGDFELTSANGGAPAGKTGHYVALGSLGARFNSLTFSGSTPPATNTATIDPLQVALNATFRQSDFGATYGALFVPTAFIGGVYTAHVLTTPLIVPRYAHLLGVSHYGVAKANAGDSRIYVTWTADKLAAVMAFGGSNSIENLTVESFGHAVMYLGSAGVNSEASIAKNSGFYTHDATHTYDALKLVGIHYNIHHDNVYLRGDKAAIELQNFAGGNNTFSNVRWDLGGPSAIKMTTGWTDPDNGVNDSAFANGANLFLRDILIEQGTGILLDAVNMGLTLENVEFADILVAASTDSLAKIGLDIYSQTGSCGGRNLTLVNTALPSSANARVSVNVVGTGTASLSGIEIIGLGGINGSTSTGNSQAIDFNSFNVPLIVYARSVDNGYAGPSFSPSATVHKIINTHANWIPLGVNAPSTGAGNSPLWNEFQDRIVLSPRTARGNRKSFFINGNQLELRQSDDTTVDMDVNPTSGFFNFRGNARFMAYAGAAAQLSIGSSVSTATGGSIALVNSGSMYMRNAAGSGNVLLIAGDTSDRAIVGDANGVCLSTSTNCAPIKGNLSGTATLDFAAITAPNCAADLTITVTGAATGDPVFLAVPTAAQVAGVQFDSWVSAANTVTVRACAFTGTPDPASGSFRATVIKF
ncbi:MAG: hypothetical protein HY234_03655 [Acidobacteria bacterium]|nr:hypothetical protein [Acidobacteriota bacterium]MBI3662132.1 hypothetical protein [Acidobacteriota bacterium]